MQRTEWLAQVEEEIIDPDRPIVDPHHHLWHHEENPYLLEHLWADTRSGHNVQQTVFVECMAEYRTEGSTEFRPVGETEFVLSVANTAKSEPSRAQIAGIVGYANLQMGKAVSGVLDSHIEIAGDLFKGIRHAAGWDASNIVRNSHTDPIEHLYEDEVFREGFAELAPKGLSFDAWNYHPQIKGLTNLARAFPDTTIIFDHFGGPLGIGPYEGKREEIFTAWKQSVSELAKSENVFAKIGGLAMPINGFGWHKADRPATSQDIVTAHKEYYLHMIDVFGPNRCMFESNFPVDKQSVSYPVLWNAFKKIAADFSEAEKNDLFAGTARRAYRISA